MAGGGFRPGWRAGLVAVAGTVLVGVLGSGGPVLAAGPAALPGPVPAREGLVPVLVGDLTTLLQALLGPAPGTAGGSLPPAPAAAGSAPPAGAGGGSVAAGNPGTAAASPLPSGAAGGGSGWRQQAVQRSLPFSVRYQPDPGLSRGQDRVLEPGRSGLAVTVSDLLMQNGRVLEVRPGVTRTVRPAVAEIIGYGTAPEAARGGSGPSGREMTMVATAYWPDPRWSDGITASGLPARYGVVAVDPRVIPLGTRLYIPGYGQAVAADTGSAIVGDRIDLCFDTRRQAVDFGVRTIPVYILD